VSKKVTARNPKTIARARELRRNATDAEALIWRHLRSRQLADAKFRRQYAYGPYILDFYSAKHHFVIELDGGQHYTDEGVERDEQRTLFLEANGLRVLRFSDRDVLKEAESVLLAIYEALGEPSP
jgi:very-short-patch-repair endonuclease